jgi:thiol:disulfide interchange protein DsbD
MKFVRFALYVLLFVVSAGRAAFADDDGFLDPEEAFAFSTAMTAPDTLELRYRVAPGYYLYRERFVLAPDTGAAQWMGEPAYPAGEMKHDPTFDKDMEVYHRDVAIDVPLKQGAADSWSLTVTSQGCAEAGLCYPPLAHVVKLAPAPGGYVVAAVAEGDASAPMSIPAPPALAVAPVSQAPAAPALLDAPAPQTLAPAAASASRAPAVPAPASGGSVASAGLGALLQAGDMGLASALGGLGWLKASGVFLVLGMLLALTPCVLPMIPILSSIVLGTAPQQQNHRLRGLGLAAAYVLGMSVVYTALGIAAGLSGVGLAAWLQTPWVLALFALLLALLALAMFDVYTFQMPALAQARLAEWSNRIPGGHATGAVVMGAVSALIVGPCVAAPLAGALLYISRTGDVLLGGSALFALAWGMGVPLLVVGGSAGALLPRTGPWMEGVKRLFGMLLLATAWWMLIPVLPTWTQMLGWAFLAIVSAVMLRAFESLPAEAGARHMFAKGAGLLLALAGLAWLVGAVSGGRDVLQPLAHFAAIARGGANATQGSIDGASANPASPIEFSVVRSVSELDAFLSHSDKPVMLDFYADWCVSCREMERYTFTDPAVAARMHRMLLLRVDVTQNDADDRALLKRFKLFGPPGTIFFAPGGQESNRRVIGFQDATRFVATLDAVLAR